MLNKQEQQEMKESFLLYTNFNKLYFSKMTREEKGLMLECIFEYAEHGICENEELNKDRTLQMVFEAVADVIDRNNQKWIEKKERRKNGAKARWEKERERKANTDIRYIEMPSGSTLAMQGNIQNMPKDYDELKDRTGITNYEDLRDFNDFCNNHDWAVSLEEMFRAYTGLSDNK